MTSCADSKLSPTKQTETPKTRKRNESALAVPFTSSVYGIARSLTVWVRMHKLGKVCFRDECAHVRAMLHSDPPVTGSLGHPRCPPMKFPEYIGFEVDEDVVNFSQSVFSLDAFSCCFIKNMNPAGCS